MKLTNTILLLFLSFSIFAQNEPKEEYHEAPDDPYIFVERENYETTPAYHFENAQIITRQVNVNEAGENMVDDAANEPSLAVNPIDPNHMAIGWRQFADIGSNFREAGFGYTIDGGESWTFPGPLEPGVFRSDPVLDFDVNGTFFYNSLTTDLACDVFKSISADTWSDPVPAYGGDKQWMVVDHTGGAGEGNIYAFWKPSFSVCSGAFTRSENDGDSFQDCTDMPNNGTRGTLAIGPDGELYATGEEDGVFHLAKSTNAADASQNIIWDFSTTVDMGGSLSLYNGPNPNGMLGQVWVAVNQAPGPYYGHVYQLATVTGFQPGDNGDIIFAKSEDGGETWNEPIRINDDVSDENYQWFGTISVAPNGRIDVAWVDTRDEPGTYLSSLYYSNSEDGGETWSVNEKMSEPFDPHLGWPSQNKIGDYYHSISDDEGMHLAWTATFTGGQDVYYSYIQPNPISSVFYENNPASSYFQINGVSPNPFSDYFELDYTLEKGAEVKIELLDVMGNELVKIEEGYKVKGEYVSQFNSTKNAMAKGVYFYKIIIDENPPIIGRVLFVK